MADVAAATKENVMASIASWDLIFLNDEYDWVRHHTVGLLQPSSGHELGRARHQNDGVPEIVADHVTLHRVRGNVRHGQHARPEHSKLGCEHTGSRGRLRDGHGRHWPVVNQTQRLAVAIMAVSWAACLADMLTTELAVSAKRNDWLVAIMAVRWADLDFCHRVGAMEARQHDEATILWRRLVWHGVS